MNIPRIVLGLALTCGPAAAQVPLSGTVYDGAGGPLLSGTVYHVTGSVHVPPGQVLTVQPGAIVKAYHEDFVVDGRLVLAGTSGQPVFFTSLFDDTAGGDTNGDGAATSPKPGDWHGIQVRAGATLQMQDGVLRYHGYGGWSGLYVTSGSATLEVADSTFSGGAVSAIDLNANRPALAVDDCAFEGNAGYAVRNAAIDTVPGFHGGTADGNGFNAIEVVDGNVLADTTITGENCLGGALALIGTVYVPAGNTLSLLDGAIAKSYHDYVTVDGSLVLDGTPAQRVVLTSLRDDAWGGDTNGDGGATVGDVGDWHGIEARAGSTLSMDNALLRCYGYGGWSGLFVTSGATTLSLVDSTFQLGETAAIDLNGHRPDLAASGCAFLDNMDYAVLDAAIDTVPGFTANTATNNLFDAILVIDAVPQADLVIGADNCPGGALVFAGTAVIPSGRTLHLTEGAVVRILHNGVVVDGHLVLEGTVDHPVIITSLYDDAAGGLVIGLPPAPGDWHGIQARAGSELTLDNAIVRYHGDGGWSGLEVVSSAATLGLNDSTFAEGLLSGLDLNGHRPAISIDGCTFSGNQGWAIDDAAIDSVAGFNGNTASGNGFDAIRVVDPSPAADTILTADNCLGGALFLATTGTVASGITLTLDPGVVLKSLHGDLSIYGGLVARGTPAQPVVMTSFLDDDWGGDTNADGAASTPAAGDWFGIDIRPGPDASRLENLLLRFPGYGGWAGLRVENATLGARGVRVEHGAANGIDVLAADDLADLVAFGCADGIRLLGGGALVRHATVAEGTGAGIRAFDPFTGRVESSVAWGNAGGDWVVPPTVPVSYSDGTGVPAGPGNFTYDPLFRDAPAGDLRMQPYSPCIDRGHPAEAASGLDLAGFPRWMDGDLDLVKRLDMGAYEFDNLELGLAADVVPGGALDITTVDHAGFAEAWLFVGIGFAEADMNRFGSLFVDLGAPYALLFWPTVPGTIPLTVPGNIPVGSRFVLQLGARLAAAPGSPGNLSNPVVLTID